MPRELRDRLTAAASGAGWSLNREIVHRLEQSLEQPAAARRQKGGTLQRFKARRPLVALDSCVNCLLCWLYCPDSAIELDGTTLTGIDYRTCKGCELCVEVCPVGAIAMVSEVHA